MLSATVTLVYVCPGSSIPEYIIAVVIVLSITIFLLIFLVFGLYYRYHYSQENNHIGAYYIRDDNQGTLTRLSEESNELCDDAKNVIPPALRNITIDDPEHDPYYITVEDVRVAEHTNEPYEIPMNVKSHIMKNTDSARVTNPLYTNI
ncbi:uncharacterized protein LOC117117358 [Anneissia japonica]|uniref:uncharacterized protein LOC117117358 n=1 Tax=Anneissia japonica TaxID=1529436 RepID=UPI00142550D4|nr:uncharacterized protein LOC117117358 [Anneissia japonica]